MTGFKILSTIAEIELRKYPISSQTVIVGDLFQLAIGATTWTACTSATVHYTRKVIAYQAATSSASEFLGYEVRGNEVVEAECGSTTAAAADNGDRMVLTDKNTVNNSHTDSTAKEAVFVQYGVGSDTTHIVGRLIVGSGVNPDAT